MGEHTNRKTSYAMNETKQNQRVRLFGHADAEEGYELRDFLQRSVVAFDWTAKPTAVSPRIVRITKDLATCCTNWMKLH
jgi:hypothetical protein